MGFGTDRINLGDVAAGVVKSFIDCFYSIWGGAVGCPSDHRIHELTVAKGVEGITPVSVMVRVWRLQRIVSTGPQDRFTPYRPDGRKDEPPLSEDTQRLGPREAITNPYCPGTSKYIVCEGALAGLVCGEGLSLTRGQQARQSVQAITLYLEPSLREPVGRGT